MRTPCFLHRNKTSQGSLLIYQVNYNICANKGIMKIIFKHSVFTLIFEKRLLFHMPHFTKNTFCPRFVVLSLVENFSEASCPSLQDSKQLISHQLGVLILINCHRCPLDHPFGHSAVVLPFPPHILLACFLALWTQNG